MPSAEYMRIYMAQRRERRRKELIALLGSRCIQCGSDIELEIDHKDPSTKSFTLSGKELDKAWSRILEEAKKCQLLCKDCHFSKTRSEDSGWSHGRVSGYIDYKCRCPECRTAYSRYKKEYRQRRKEAGLAPV